MTMQHMRLETGRDGIAVLTLDRGDRTENVIDDGWLNDLDRALDRIGADESLNGLMVVSAKERSLTAPDLTMPGQEVRSMSPVQGFEISQRVSGLFRRIELLPIPVVAVIEGAALGVGLELALACDHRIVADDPGARIGFPDVNLGRITGAGGSQRLPRMIGVPAALDILLTGNTMDGTHALELGLVDEIASMASLVAAARHWLSTATKTAKPWDRKGFAPPESRGLLLPEVAATYSLAAAGVAARTGYDNPAPIALLSAVFEGMQLPFDRALQIESKYFGKVIANT
ncbi:MAG: enoyl-CoA hydratase-related protein [Novosphingobium sp.]